MALPKLATAKYELQLPSTAETIKYRPFLVKEQKVLMMANESKDQKQVIESVKEIITNCTFGAIDVNKLPLFDIEYIFIKLRAKSVGEKAKVSVICPDDKETKVDIEINLDQIDMTMKEDHSNIININDEVTMTMGYPMLKDFANVNVDTNDTDAAFSLIKNSVQSVSEGDKVHRRVDFTDIELEEFIDSLDTEQLGKVMNFYTTMPKLRHVVKVTNPKTKVQSDVVIEGLASFLA